MYHANIRLHIYYTTERIYKYEFTIRSNMGPRHRMVVRGPYCEKVGDVCIIYIFLYYDVKSSWDREENIVDLLLLPLLRVDLLALVTVPEGRHLENKGHPGEYKSKNGDGVAHPDALGGLVAGRGDLGPGLGHHQVPGRGQLGDSVHQHCHGLL